MDECAVGAISEGDGKYVIDTDTAQSVALALMLVLPVLSLKNN
jgi:hypothetical protein